MPVFTDQMGNNVTVENSPPRRIISLVPSQTELLYHLGLGDSIVAQTIFCIHPEDKFKDAVKIGGTKKLKLDKIRELKPDLIIGNKEENDQEQITILQKEFPVWMSDIVTFEQSLDMINGIGEITGCQVTAQRLRHDIETAFGQFRKHAIMYSGAALYLIWKGPYMAAGTDTYIHQMLLACGLQNVLRRGNISKDISRYPELSEDEIRSLNPDVVLLSSEPYPFKDKHIAELQELLPQSKIILADGEMFSWYGYRMLYLPHYYNSVLKPQIV